MMLRRPPAEPDLQTDPDPYAVRPRKYYCGTCGRYLFTSNAPAGREGDYYAQLPKCRGCADHPFVRYGHDGMIPAGPDLPSP